ncbi:extensin family protein [Xanthobacter sp.]|uniref:extensin-like domain-containing protein n=1 Tax=Xanthobacter sp. TaxID=35809 RepID=UPI0025F8B27D|nr:extensin family protein [Xanthobacter sp.]
MVMPTACADLVAQGEIEASLDASVSPNPACGTFVPIRLTAIRLADGRMVPLKPAAISRCEMTVAAAAWMSEALAAAVAAAGGVLSAIRIADSYNCRPRNRVAGAKMSEHGRGNAVDVGGFELDDGRVWTVAKGELPMALRASMKDSSCTRFATVLGPGSDGYHEDHIHVDLAQRRNDFKLCQWNLDAGSAVAPRKDKPVANAPAASAEIGAGGAPEDKEAADKEAAAAASAGTAAAEPESAPAPPPKGSAAGGKAAPGKGAAAKDTAAKGTAAKGAIEKGGGRTTNGQAKTGQASGPKPKNAQEQNAQDKGGGSKTTQPRQSQSD